VVLELHIVEIWDPLTPYNPQVAVVGEEELHVEEDVDNQYQFGTVLEITAKTASKEGDGS
jgi:hypothetical protein